jgi:hypothetical protein
LKDKKLGTIAGITNWNEWMWPDEESEKGYIFARPLPGIGSWTKFSPQKIGNILKNYSIEKPNPKISQHTQSHKPWTVPFVEYKGIMFEFIIYILLTY